MYRLLLDSRTDRGFCLEGSSLMDSFTEVVVVGAGPTGLMLAGDLARAGVSCTVLERRAEETNLTRAFAVHARTLEMLDARGLADDLVATGRRVGALRLFGKLEVDLSRLPTRFPYVLVTPQYHTERVLEEHASALGAQIVRGAEVVDLRQDNDGVELDVRYKDGTLGTRRAMYAVGADGVRSKVRQALALPFPGHSAIQSVMLADVQLSEAPEDVLTVNVARDGFIFIAPFGDGWYRVIAWDRRRELPDHLARAWHRLRHARPPLDVPIPQRRAPGPALPGRASVPRRRRRTRSLSSRRSGHEYWPAGRSQPRMEARRRHARLGAGGPSRQLPQRAISRRARSSARQRC